MAKTVMGLADGIPARSGLRNDRYACQRPEAGALQIQLTTSELLRLRQSATWMTSQMIVWPGCLRRETSRSLSGSKMNQNPSSATRYDLLAINLTIVIASTTILALYGVITVVVIAAAYGLTSFTPFDVDIAFKYLVLGPIGATISIICDVSGIVGALVCTLQMNRTAKTFTVIALILFLLTIITPLLFVGFL